VINIKIYWHSLHFSFITFFLYSKTSSRVYILHFSTHCVTGTLPHVASWILDWAMWLTLKKLNWFPFLKKNVLGILLFLLLSLCYLAKICTRTFIAALIRNNQPLECPSVDDCLNKLWRIPTTNSNSAVKQGELLRYATTWIGLQGIILSEWSPFQKLGLHLYDIFKMTKS
jgi:hypothetical protein